MRAVIVAAGDLDSLPAEIRLSPTYCLRPAGQCACASGRTPGGQGCWRRRARATWIWRGSACTQAGWVRFG